MIEKLGPNKHRVIVHVWDPAKGYSVKRRKTITGNYNDAVLWESDLLKQQTARSLTSVYASTFAEAVDIYTENLRIRGRLSDQHANMVGYIRRELGDIRLEVFADKFASWRKHIMLAPTRFGKARGSASVNRYTAIVRAVFGVLVKRDIVEKNPITSVRFPKLEERPRNRYPTPEERLRLLLAVKEHRPWLLPFVLYQIMVPCRSGELVSATREMYNRFTDLIHIPDSKNKIPVTKPVPTEMIEYFRNIPHDCPWLFYQELGAGKYRRVNHYRKAWEYCCKVAGVENFHIHDLRHTAVTDMVLAGNPDRVIMAVAGWKSPAMIQTYHYQDGVRAAQQVVFGQGTAPSQAPSLTKGAM